MTGQPVDVEALNKLWSMRWPGRRHVPYELRGIRDQWVRFHALPDSKRYPDNESEYEIVLARHNTVLAELITDGTLLVATAEYSDGPQQPLAGRSAQTAALHPDATYWTNVRLDSDIGDEYWMHQYVSHMTWSVGRLDHLLRHVADEAIANVLLADIGLRWLYHPYDGGMDVILPSSADRDALKDRHSDWLSGHPSGL